MKYKKFKKILYILLVILSISMNIKHCLAEGDTSEWHETKNDVISGSGLTDNGDGTYGETKGCSVYKSSISANYDPQSEIIVNVYDYEGNNIMNQGGNISLNDAIKAGTWVGVNIEEKHTAHYSISVSASETKWKATCNYSYVYYESYCKPVKCALPEQKGCCTPSKRKKTGYYSTTSGLLNKCEKDSYECPPTTSDAQLISGPNFSETSVGAPDYASSLKSRLTGLYDGAARKYVGTKLANINYLISNDYDELKYDNLTINTNGINEYSPEKKHDKGYQQSYYYSPNKICMNLKTSDVIYKQKECNISENEIEIKNKIAKDGKEYWHYFAPLNIKSTNIFSIDINGEKTISNQQCINFANDNPNNYFTKIRPQNENISLPSTNNTSDRRKFIKDLERTGSGCIFKKSYIIPITQKFYNEVDGTRFEGFNFYYRPIDINEPFPNGLNDTSIWYDWSKDPNQDPDITDSYNSTTYVAAVGTNTDTIRKYTTPELPYTTWSNMKLDGTSSFIDFLEKNNIGKRYDKTINKPYKLGCGDGNKSQTNKDGSKNYLYQEWCDNS